MRTQVLLVAVVFRTESRRLAQGAATPAGQLVLRELRTRSIAILDNVRAELDGQASWHADISSLIGEVAEGLDGAE